ERGRRRRPVRAPDLVPTHAGGAAGGDTVGHDHRLVVAEIAVGEPVHEPVAQGVERLTGAELGNAGPATAGAGEPGDGDVRRAREGGVGTVRPVDVELPAVERARAVI